MNILLDSKLIKLDFSSISFRLHDISDTSGKDKNQDQELAN